MIELKKASERAKKVGDITEEWWRRVDAVEWDLDVLALRIRWSNGVSVEARVGEKGVVERAVARGRKGERLREAERRLRGDLGGLAARIGWIGEGAGIEMR